MRAATRTSLFFPAAPALLLLLALGCAPDRSAWRLPEACHGDCEVARDAASFADAVANATDAGNACVCLDTTAIPAAVTIAKSMTIVGRGPESRIVAPTGATGLTIRADGVTLRDLAVASDTIAVDIAQADHITISGVRLTALAPADGAISFALAVRDSSVTLIDSTLVGDPATATAAADISGGSIIFSSVTATGFGRYGVTLTSDAALSWTGGGLSDLATADAALFVTGATAELHDLVIERIDAPTGALYGGRGIIATDAATLDITDSTIRDCASIGLLIDGTGQATVTGGAFSGNGLTGIWLQNGEGQLTLADTTVNDNRTAGILSLRSCGISVSDARIETSRSALWHDDLIGDGISLYGALNDQTCPVTLSRVLFADNFRAALIADGGTGEEPLSGLALAEIVVERSTADAPGTYGVVLQNGVAPAGLLDGVTANPFRDADAALDNPLTIITDEQDIPRMRK